MSKEKIDSFTKLANKLKMKPSKLLASSGNKPMSEMDKKKIEDLFFELGISGKLVH